MDVINFLHKICLLLKCWLLEAYAGVCWIESDTLMLLPSVAQFFVLFWLQEINLHVIYTLSACCFFLCSSYIWSWPLASITGYTWLHFLMNICMLKLQIRYLLDKKICAFSSIPYILYVFLSKHFCNTTSECPCNSAQLSVQYFIGPLIDNSVLEFRWILQCAYFYSAMC